MPRFPSSTLLLTGEAEIILLCRGLFFKPFPHHKSIHLPANCCYSVENITHAVSNKSIQHQISVCFPPLITTDYTETEFYFTQEAKWASSVCQLLQCSSVSEPFPAAYCRTSLWITVLLQFDLLLVVRKATWALITLTRFFYQKGLFGLLGVLEHQAVSKGLCRETSSSSWLENVKQTMMAPLLFQEQLFSFPVHPLCLS